MAEPVPSPLHMCMDMQEMNKSVGAFPARKKTKVCALLGCGEEAVSGKEPTTCGEEMYNFCCDYHHAKHHLTRTVYYPGVPPAFAMALKAHLDAYPCNGWTDRVPGVPGWASLESWSFKRVKRPQCAPGPSGGSAGHTSPSGGSAGAAPEPDVFEGIMGSVGRDAGGEKLCV